MRKRELELARMAMRKFNKESIMEKEEGGIIASGTGKRNRYTAYRIASACILAILVAFVIFSIVTHVGTKKNLKFNFIIF